MFNTASCVGAGVYGKRQKSVKTAFKILIASDDMSKTLRLSHQSKPSLSSFPSVQIPCDLNLNRRKRSSRGGNEQSPRESNLSIREFAFPCTLRAVCLRKWFDLLSGFGRLDLVPLLSIRRRVSGRTEWLSSAVHSRSGSHSAHGRARQTALELPQPVPRRDRRPDGGSPAPRL